MYIELKFDYSQRTLNQTRRGRVKMVELFYVKNKMIFHCILRKIYLSKIRKRIYLHMKILWELKTKIIKIVES